MVSPKTENSCLQVLQIGSVGSSGSGKTKDGATKYTTEVLAGLSGKVSVYYERINGFKSYVKCLALIPKYHKKNIDIIHVQGSDIHSIIGILLAMLFRKPLIVTLYAYGLDERRTLKRPLITGIFPILIEQIALSVSKQIITVSEWQKKRIGKNLRDKVIVIYPGISKTRLNRTAEKTKNDAVCITGSLLYPRERALRKGIDILGEIAKLTPQVTFHIVGGTYNEVKKILHSPPPNIVFHGYLDEKRLQILLLRSKFIITPSRHEAFSIPVLEGMAYGCIPLISNYCGVQDIVKDCGFVLELNPEFFSKTLLMLLGRVDEVDGMGTNCERISREFTWEKAAVKHAQIYQTIAFSNRTKDQTATQSTDFGKSNSY